MSVWMGVVWQSKNQTWTSSYSGKILSNSNDQLLLPTHMRGQKLEYFLVGLAFQKKKPFKYFCCHSFENFWALESRDTEGG